VSKTGAWRRQSSLWLALGALGVASLVSGCPAQPRPDVLPSKGVVVPTADKSVFLRASFDDDPSPYLGRFVPNDIAVEQTDENQGVQTRCSKFIKFQEVNAGGNFDEYYNSSTSGGVSLSVPGVAGGKISAGAQSTVRVRYQLKKKLRAVVEDQEGFDQCCTQDAAQCPDFIIGEFFYGTGEVLQAVGNSTDFGADGIYSAVSGELEFKDEVAWKRSSTFEDLYFAFRKQRMRTGQVAGGAGDPNDCAWAYNVPTSLDGKFFVGVSPPAASEGDARNLAMRNARQQVVQFLGEYITSAMKTRSSAVEGILEDESVVSAVAEGLVSKVKDQRWCAPESSSSPRGQMVSVKVLAFFPEADKKEAAQQALVSFQKNLQAQGKLDAGLKQELEGAAKEIAK
jgi:hypothetical protein